MSPKTGPHGDSDRGNLALGVGYGFVGVLCFSFTLPATMLALSAFPPLFTAAGRTVFVFPLPFVFLLACRSLRPPPSARRGIAVLIAGNVIGFPVFTALALEHGSTVNAAVILGLMPLATATISAVRDRQRPSAGFWTWAGAGACAVIAFSILRNGISAPAVGDVFTLLAVTTGSFGYTEGARLTRQHGPMRPISWSIVYGFPLALAVCLGVSLESTPNFTAVGTSWFGLLYVSLISSFLAFVPWNLGLARGGTARISQIQLLQPLLTLAWSALLLSEQVSDWALGACLAVLGCVIGATRSR